MEVMGVHFVDMDPPDEWTDLLVVCCECGVQAWSGLPHLPNFA